MAEFGPVLWMFLVLFVIPLLDLISFGSAVGTVMYVATMGAHQAGGCSTYTDAIARCNALEVQCRPFLKMAKTTPINAAGATVANGISVAVVVTPLDGSAGPPPYNAPGVGGGKIPNTTPDPSDPNPPAQYNTSNCVYNYIVTCRYSVMPIFNFYGTPLLKNVPMLGKPVPVTYAATAPVEHPDGLNE
jgi:hypothetical protein